MSQPDLTNAGLYEEKPSNTVYTACLGISFISLCIVSWLLSLELKVYDNDFKALEPKKLIVPTVAPPLETEAVAPTEGETPTEEPAATPAASPTGTGSTDPDGGTGTPATPAGTAGSHRRQSTSEHIQEGRPRGWPSSLPGPGALSHG